MSLLRSHKLCVLFIILAVVLTLALGLLYGLNFEKSAVSVASTIAATDINFDMFKSFTAFKAWLDAIPYFYYVFIGLGLLVIAILALALAIFKKARVRRNDVNVLILVGDDEDKIDSSVFKEHYAVVVVSKPSTMTPVQPRILQSVIPLEDNRRYIPIPNENPSIIADVSGENTSTVEEIMYDETPIVKTVKPIAEVHRVEEVEKEEIQQIEEPEPIEPTKPIEEPRRKGKGKNKQIEQAPIIVAESHEPEPEIEEIAPMAEETIYNAQESYNTYVTVDDEVLFDTEPEPEVEIQQEINMNEVFESAYADAVTEEPEVEEMYDESEFVVEGFENVEFDANEFNVSSIVVSDNDSEEDYVEPFVPIIDEESFECITVEEERPVPVVEKVAPKETSFEVQEFENVTPYVATFAVNDEEILFEEETPVIEAVFEETAPIVKEEPIVDDVIIGMNTKTVRAVEKSEDDVDHATLIVPKFASSEDLAYSIVKEEAAVQSAIDDVNAGVLIVDADGDGLSDEVLEDKDILKYRYKTVDMEKRMRRTTEDVKGFYSDIKNILLGYKGVKSRISKKFDTFTLGRFIVAKLALRGNVLNVYLALPNEQVEDKYFVEDVSDSETYGKTPTLHKVKSKRGCKYGIDLIQELMTAIGVPINENFVPINYVALYPPENIADKMMEILHLIGDKIHVDDTDVLSDEEALEFIQIVKNKEHTINKFNPINKYVAFLDDIADLYEPGDTVTIDNLIEKGALPKDDNLYLEIRAKGMLEKPLTVEAHSFDVKSVKMLVLTNGAAIQYK